MGSPRLRKQSPQSDLFELIPWALANGIGEGNAYDYCRRANNPMPHVKQGRRILVEPGEALEWLRREFGVGYGAEPVSDADGADAA